MSGIGVNAPSPRRFAWLPPRLAGQEVVGYSLAVLAALTLLLCVAIAIDLAKHLNEVMARRPANAGLPGILSGTRHLLWYLSLRIVDMVTRLLPFAVFGGVLGYEMWSLFSRRRAIHWASGRHPLQLLGGVLWIGLAFGSLQYFLDAVGRPAAVMTQAAERLGAYGRRFERDITPNRRWIIAPSQIIEARIRFRPSPILIEPAVYSLDSNGRVSMVIRANIAQPIGSGEYWRLIESQIWTADPSVELNQTSYALDRIVRLNVRPLDLAYFSIPAKYVPQSSLSAILADRIADVERGEKAVWLHLRRANAVLPGLLALLAVAASLVVGAYRPGAAAMLGLAAVGYGAHAAIKTIVTLGEVGALSAVATAWGPPALVLALSIGLLLAGLRRN